VGNDLCVTIKAFAFDDQGARQISDNDEIAEQLTKDGTGLWVDLLNPSQEEIDLVETELGLHPLAIEDVTKHGQRPKLEVYEDHAFVVAYAACECADRYDLVEIDIFLGRNWLLTIHDRTVAGAQFSSESVRERLGRFQKHKEIDGSTLLYVVLDEIVDTYFDAIDTFGERVDELEERIFSDPDPEKDEMPIQREMLRIRKELLGFRRRVAPLREVLIQLLRDDVEWVSDEERHYFQDVFDHVLRISDEIDTRRELIGNAMEAHLALVSNHMNEIMKKMTSWGAILIVATLIAGIYGMNFDHMPELHLRYGYFGALGAMLATTLGLYRYFKRKRWL
jgi:magnesium transporter